MRDTKLLKQSPLVLFGLTVCWKGPVCLAYATGARERSPSEKAACTEPAFGGELLNGSCDQYGLPWLSCFCSAACGLPCLDGHLLATRLRLLRPGALTTKWGGPAAWAIQRAGLPGGWPNLHTGQMLT